MNKTYYIFNLKILFECTGHHFLKESDIILNESCPWFVGEEYGSFDDIDLKYQLKGYDTVEEIMIACAESLGIA